MSGGNWFDGMTPLGAAHQRGLKVRTRQNSLQFRTQTPKL